MLNNQGDAKVEGERIIRVLKDAITHMKMMFALQYMGEHEWRGLEKHMDEDDFKQLIVFCSNYLNMRNAPKHNCSAQSIVEGAATEYRMTYEVEGTSTEYRITNEGTSIVDRMTSLGTMKYGVESTLKFNRMTDEGNSTMNRMTEEGTSTMNRMTDEGTSTMNRVTYDVEGTSRVNRMSDETELSECDDQSQGEQTHGDVQKVMKVITKNENSANFFLKIYKENNPNPFLSDLELFSRYMEEKIHQTPQMEQKLDARMTHLHQENETLKEQVAALRAKANFLRKKQSEVLIDKEEILKNSQLKINLIRKNTQDYIAEKIEESEARMMRDWAISERAQADMAEDLKQQNLYFENAQRDQMAKEKDCRAQRAKAEAQLVALLQKYDSDIGSRHEEKEQLTAALAKEREQLEMLQEQFDEQEVEYLQLMNEKEKYERDVWNEKIYEIQCKIAARKIQRYFRRYLERSKSRKKGKRGRGKKK